MAKITTIEGALKAVKKDGRALENVPENLKTAEVCLAALNASYFAATAFYYVPEKIKTAEIYYEAAKNYRDYGRDRYREARDWTYIVPKEMQDEVRRRYESE